ncbi:hypothetical protein [Sinorhizobium meliloti]|uniref:Uncharacterized protein n=1 Tax=Rhizobium meliloti TaxID=382 RepID=A0AAW9TN18_RHIML|nr:hypothetical protein [Sinorhizobium meliloti]MQW33559.1 hypothetical protein [Sinorhizobium meliloti]MQW46109.1 hypothetical protein [Sinorhizobium meliloti]
MIGAIVKGIAMVWGIGLSVFLMGSLFHHDPALGLIGLSVLVGSGFGLICFND